MPKNLVGKFITKKSWMHKVERPRRLLFLIENMNERITPETYKKMNEEFEEHGTPLRFVIPTQEEIDKHIGTVNGEFTNE